jgi:hypothetical protein
MLGLFAAHRLQEHGELGEVAKVVHQLRRSLGWHTHPDVETLGLLAVARDDKPQITYGFSVPPMLQRSWVLLDEGKKLELGGPMWESTAYWLVQPTFHEAGSWLRWKTEVAVPLTPRKLAELVLSSTPKPTPWSSPDAEKRFGRALAHRSVALRWYPRPEWRHSFKHFLCKEVAELLVNVILPNLNVPVQQALASIAAVFQRARYVPRTSTEQLEPQFAALTRELKAESEACMALPTQTDRLAEFLWKNWS